MINFSRVSYRNFLSTGNKDTVIHLNKNKNTLILGRNGAGKSTVLEAISFGLYGKSMRSANKPQLINSITGKGLLVEIDFATANKSFKVRRGIKPAVFEIFEDGKLINQDSAARDYQDVLESSILKLNHKSFSQLVILSVANYTPFMRLPAAARREVIEDLLNIQIFSLMNVLLKEKISVNKTEVTNNDYEIRLAQNQLDMHRKHLDEMNQNTQDLIAQRTALREGYQNEITTSSEAIAKLEKDQAALRETLAEKSTIVADLESVLALRKAVLDKRKKIEREIVFYESTDNCPTCKQIINEAHKAGEISKKNTTLAEAGNAYAKLEKKVSRLQSRVEGFTVREKELAALHLSLTEYHIKVVSFGKLVATLDDEIVQLKSKTVEDDTTEALTAELNRLQAKRETLIKDREVFLMAAQLLKDGGIKSRIIRQYIPIINRLINKYLAQMDFFVAFELDEVFHESIKSRFRDEFTYESFSQGERLRIDLALLFTWRAIAKLRNSASCNLLFMDEILDSSLDAGGVDEFLKIINDLTKDQNCFIISHRGDQLADKFDHTITFQKIKNFSQVIQ